MGKLLLLNGNVDKLQIDIVCTGTYQRKIEAVIDTGAYHSFMGIRYVLRLGYEQNALNSKKIVPIYGFTSEPKRRNSTIQLSEVNERTEIPAAYMLEIKHIKIGDIDFPTPIIWVPIIITFNAKKEIHIRYIRENIMLIGTDLLRMLNYGISVEDKPVFKFSKSKNNYRPKPDYDLFLRFIEK